MNNNKTIYKYQFQHFPFHLVDRTPRSIFLPFSFALGPLNSNFFSFKSNSLKNFIHSCAILNSDSRNPQPILLEASGSSNPRSPFLEALERLENESLSDLQLIRYQGKPVDGAELDNMPPSSTIAEAFP
jgi:hypothetical protein